MEKTAIIGGGAAGFFAAINLKEMMSDMQVTIFESSNDVLRKVRISGGGRCNCTNSFREVTDLVQVYPRGHRLLKRLFNIFDHDDAYEWFERHGVRLVVQEDQCVFPLSQDSHTIVDMFKTEAKRKGIVVKTNHKILSLSELSDYDYKIVTTGGSPQEKNLQWLQHEVVTPIPSLYTFNIDDRNLQSLMGTVVEDVSVMIPGTKMRAKGPLLVTHWGLSGPAILRLSSYAARLLFENNYEMPLSINWSGGTEAEVQEEISRIVACHPLKQVTSVRPFGLPARLWDYLSEKCLAGRTYNRWKEITSKDLNRLTNLLTNDEYCIAGRAPFKDEFVTCGGIALSAVNPSTLESKRLPHLYFAGEVLDIDGITGGFNFQAAWTTAYTVANAIVHESTRKKEAQI